jgi:outer membrane receptor protein involved in Fe transport
MNSKLKTLLASLALGSLGVLSCGHATAADKVGDQELDEVIVTGSRIAIPNLASASPIQVVTATDIKASGKADISDIITGLPQNWNNDLGQDLGNRTSGLTAAGGVATADLRGLGPNRTLVLVDGRRLGQGSPYTAIQSPAPDLDQIPMAMVDRVEVVTGGASAVYGSDAIAGVVNFILKKNFQGLQLDYAQSGFYHNNHNQYAQDLNRAFRNPNVATGTAYDGKTRNVSLVGGANFDDGRGNVTGYFTYLQSDPVRSGQRDFGSCQVFNDISISGVAGGATCFGSSNSNYFRAFNTATNALTGPSLMVSGTSFVTNSTSVSAVPPAIFNSQQYIYLKRDDLRYTAGFTSRFEVNDSVKPYAELNFMSDRTHQEIAPSGLFRDSNPLTASGHYEINCSNPLLSAQQRSALCSAAQIAADAANPGSTSATVRIGRRNVEGGGRSSDYEHTNYRVVVGAQGDLGDAWNYDAYTQYYYTNFYNSNDHYMDFQKITNALQVTGTVANPVCISGTPCIPYNIFREGGVQQDQLAYLYTSGTAFGSTSLRTLHADITGHLGQYHIKSPWASDDMAINLGYEHRAEKLRFRPDAAELSGLLSGFGGASVAIDNTITVSEWFTEFRAPLISDRRAIHALTAGAGYRTSKYSLAGNVNTYKFDLQYSPTVSLQFRGSLQRAIRAPSIVELFNPQLVGQITFGSDPCAPTTAGATINPATASLAQCQNTGVTAAQYGNGGTTNSIPQGAAGQLSQLQGGNPNLKPEQADTYSLGVTFNPLRNWNASFDYFRINLEHGVGPLPASIIMTNCLTTGNPVYCSQIVRTAAGGLTGASVASQGYIVQTNVNVGAGSTSGVDVQSTYMIPLGGAGSANLALNGSYLLKTETTPYSGAHTYDCTGLFGFACQTINPRWRHMLRATWQTPRNVSVAVTWRYLGAVKQDNNDSDPTLHFASYGEFDPFNARIPAYNWFDLAATYKFGKFFEARAGVNNLTDKNPPLVSNEIIGGGNGNTYSVYDILGREAFLGLTAKF